LFAILWQKLGKDFAADDKIAVSTDRLTQYKKTFSGLPFQQKLRWITQLQQVIFCDG